MLEFLTNFGADNALIQANEVGIPVVSENNLIHNLLLPVYFWAAVCAVIVIIVAGYFFVTSNGNAQQITRAKQAILGAIVGLIVIFIAFTITQFVLGTV